MTTTAMTANASNGVSDLAGTTATNQYVEDIECLRKLFRSKNLTKFSIGRIACSAGSSSGDNYMSLVKRVTIHDAGKEAADLLDRFVSIVQQIEVKLRSAY